MNSSNSTARRPLNVSYLVMGLVFLGIAGTWALQAAGLVDGDDAGWLVPLSLVLAGAAGLVAFAARGVRGRRPGDTDTDRRFDGDSYPTDDIHDMDGETR